MPLSVFIETTIPSYYVARPSRDLLLFARQEMTRDWWDFRRHQFRLFTSQLVRDEAAIGEPAKAVERLKMLTETVLLDLNEQAAALATNILGSGILPANAVNDASHLAVAGTYGVDCILTWNCKHIANPFLADRLRACFSEMGVDLPIVCTPEQFVADDDSEF